MKAVRSPRPVVNAAIADPSERFKVGDNVAWLHRGRRYYGRVALLADTGATVVSIHRLQRREEFFTFSEIQKIKLPPICVSVNSNF
jgi:hypothetical protein